MKVGDMARPLPEWRDDPNNVPSGRVVRIEPWSVRARSMSRATGERSRPMFSSVINLKPDAKEDPSKSGGSLIIYKPCCGTLLRMLNLLNSGLWGSYRLLSTEAPAS
jgi:hypothetical protein